MKQFLQLIFFMLLASATTMAAGNFTVPARPQPARYVNDFANVLTKEQQSKLEAKLQSQVKARGNEIAIVIMDSTGLSDLRPLGDSILHQWGIGKRHNGRGVVILVDMQSKKVFMSVGKGLSKTITAESQVMLLNHYVFPAFSRQQYYEGLDQCISAIATVLIPPQEIKNTYDKKTSPSPAAGWLIAVIVVIGAGIYFIWREKKIAKK